ncbi:glutathione S-transferase family protein [Kordiimonas marina]|uniref:glutathione S-transferase family protein n=1 Tax=Kordiimonas marina TaxID=2872312 RepID=UPI001FF3F1EB|nr:glutathione S-transferase family protein [Kordiimonas marina]MCJ9430635.1 glutathione S-transferase family protein [Kordiimonas marina]
MALVLHYHPLSSFCHKVLIALYEKEIDFDLHHLDLAAPGVRERFNALWPVGKMPVLEDSGRGQVMGEASIIIEYLDLHYPGARQMLPADADAALEVRLWGQIMDNYVQHQMQKCVTDGMRPEGKGDPFGVTEAAACIKNCFRLINDRMKDRAWLAGEDFSLADCAAEPALFYGRLVVPMEDFPHLSAYFERLIARPTVARVLEEARPWFHLLPVADRLEARFC